MKLSDARRVAVRKQVRIRFSLANGMVCVIDEHGLGRVEKLDGPPGFNLEEEFARAGKFALEPAGGAARKGAARGVAREITRGELEALAAEKSAASSEHED